MDHPGSLTTEEFEEWKEKKLRPVQKRSDAFNQSHILIITKLCLRVLTVLSLWLEEYGLLQDSPHVAPRLREFLSLILDPSSLALTAKYMVQSLDRLVSSFINTTQIVLIYYLREQRNKLHLLLSLLLRGERK